jgi:PAS domain S-box-containing protein
MIWETIPIVLLLVVAGLLTALSAVIFWRTRTFSKGAIPLAVIMGSVALWSWSSALGLASYDPALLILARVFEYAAIAIIPGAFVQFSLLHSGKGWWSGPLSWALLLAVPVFTGVLLAAVTIDPILTQGGALPAELYPQEGFFAIPLFWIFFGYASLLMLFGCAIIIQSYQSPSGMYRGQLACLLIATLPPLFLYWAFVFRIRPFGIIDLAPISCIISVVALTAGIEQFSLFDIVPMEYGPILRQIPAGIVVLDSRKRIIEINPAALRILKITGDDITGTPVTGYFLSHEIPLKEQDGLAGERTQTIQRELGGVTHYIDLRCIPIRSGSGEHNGYIIVLTDVTDQTRTEQSLAKARKNINLLTSITRHDILNQLTVIILHNEILKEAIKEPPLAKSVHEQERAAKNIRRQIAFTKDYEKLGENLPQWVPIEKLFVRLQEGFGYKYIHYSIHVEGLEVFADPLIERVFNNLLDNSLRFGEKVTSIRLLCQQHIDGLTIIYEDNGIGIPAADKNRIFQRGIGRNSGFGLFFSKEILSITGITMRETGEKGTGARFEIIVPWGKFRFRTGESGALAENGSRFAGLNL